MQKKLYVGGLPYSTKDDQLRTALAEVDEVTEASVVTDRDTGRSRGFGFVEMATEDDAQKAIDSLNGTDLDGRNINVNEAKPREERS